MLICLIAVYSKPEISCTIKEEISFLRKEEIEPGEVNLLFIHLCLGKVSVYRQSCLQGRSYLVKSVGSGIQNRFGILVLIFA